MASYSEVLAAHRQAIDSLNVFPVPDGDTGTNMAMTAASVVKEIESGDRRNRRGLQSHQPRLANGGQGELRGDTMPDFARVERGYC